MTQSIPKEDFWKYFDPIRLSKEKLEKFDPKEYFSEYDYFEELKPPSQSSDQSLSSSDQSLPAKFKDLNQMFEEFQQDYGKGMQTYSWDFYRVGGDEGNKGNKGGEGGEGGGDKKDNEGGGDKKDNEGGGDKKGGEGGEGGENKKDSEVGEVGKVKKDGEDKSTHRFFVAAHSILTENEKKKLEPYCPCKFHNLPGWFIYVKILSFAFVGFFASTYVWNIVNWQLYSQEFDLSIFASIFILLLFSVAICKFGWSAVYAIPQGLMFCPTCHGCILSDDSPQWMINEARERARRFLIFGVEDYKNNIESKNESDIKSKNENDIERKSAVIKKEQ